MSRTAAAKNIGFTNYYTATVQLALILGLLYLTSLHSYLLFHSLVEMAGVIITGLIFIIIWNARRHVDNGYFLFIGIAFLFVSDMTMLHLLAYKGMGVFHETGANLATQLWIAGRYLAAVSFLLAPFFIRKKIDIPLTVVLYSTAFTLLVFTIFVWKNFPVAYIDGQGITEFKKDSEYAISLLFGTSALMLYAYGKHFDLRSRKLLISSLIVSIAAGIAFTEYVSVYGVANLIGHLLLITSFYLMYLGIIEIALRRPGRNLYRNLALSRLTLRNSEKKLQIVNEALEEKVRVRTYDLQKSNEELNAKNILLKLAAQTNSRKKYLKELLKLLKDWTGCELVGVRIKDESGNMPYNAHLGFSQKFWEMENWLSVKNDHCICGRVMQGRPDFQDLKMMSDDGSFICNNTPEFFNSLSEEDKKRFRGNCARQGFMSLGVVPIWYSRQIIGLIHVADKENNKLSDGKIEFLESLSSLVGAAIHKYNAIESLAKSNRALEVLSEGNHILVHSKSESELLSRVCGMIVKTGGYAVAWIGYANNSTDTEVNPIASAGIDKKPLDKLVASSRGGDKKNRPSIIVLNTGKTYVRRNIQTNPVFSYLKKQAVELNFKSSITLPLKNKNNVFGVITIYAKESIAFDQEEIGLLEELADDMSFGINSIKMQEAKERSEKQLIESYQHLGMINRKISVLLDLSEDISKKKNLGNYILETAISISQADLGLLYKFDEKNGSFNLLFSRGIGKKIDEELKFFNQESHQFLKSLVARRKKLEVSSDVYNLGCFNINNKIRCYLIIPLKKRKTEKLKGAIFLGYKNKKKLFEQELEFFDVFERHASAALFTAGAL